MQPAPAPSPCHSERARLAVARGIRNLSPLLLLLPLVVVAPACEKLPAAPNIPPTASFIFNPVSPINAGETPVSFNASGSRDSDGTIASYDWNWGDGTPEQSTTSPTIVHVFADTPAGCVEVTYAVLLTVVDDKGDTATASQQVRVIELPVPGSAACR
jgi:PKD repeat protein